ncbi:hypothetical protein [Ferruginibacter profundus]
MIHKRFNHTRHLIWSAFILTVFTGHAVSHRSKELTPSVQEVISEKELPARAAVINTIAIK